MTFQSKAPSTHCRRETRQPRPQRPGEIEERNHSIEPLLAQLYRSVFHADELRVFLSDLGEDTHCNAEALKHDSDRRMCATAGWSDPSGCPPASDANGAQRSRAWVEPGSRDVLQPHLRNACAIQQRISQLEAQILTLRGVLDHLAVGIALLDSNGHCLFANKMIHTFEQAGMKLSQGRLQLCAAREQLQLSVLADLAVVSTAALDARMVLHDIHGRPSLLLTLSTLLHHEAEADGDSAHAMVFVQPIQPYPHEACAAIRDLFGFTVAEAQLALELFETGDLAEACERLGKSLNTGRVQLRKLMEKTGCCRQSGLFRVLSVALSMPGSEFTPSPHNPFG